MVGNNIARAMGVRSGQLKKWSKYKPKQRARFETEFSKALASSSMCVAAVSAQGSTIELSFGHMVHELGLSGLVAPLQRNSKPYLEFGPFLRVSDDASTTEVRFQILRARALPLVFVVHFMARIHQLLLSQLRLNDPRTDWVDWQISPDIFAGGYEGEMSSLFFALVSILASAGIVRGNLRGHTHIDGDQGVDLADNIAGMLQGRVASGLAVVSERVVQRLS